MNKKELITFLQDESHDFLNCNEGLTLEAVNGISGFYIEVENVADLFLSKFGNIREDLDLGEDKNPAL